MEKLCWVLNIWIKAAMIPHFEHTNVTWQAAAAAKDRKQQELQKKSLFINHQARFVRGAIYRSDIGNICCALMPTRNWVRNFWLFHPQKPLPLLARRDNLLIKMSLDVFSGDGLEMLAGFAL